MEHWPTTAVEWISENREWLFSGAGLVVLSAIWAVFRYLGSRQAAPPVEKATVQTKGAASSFGDEKQGGDSIKPLMVHTTDGYLAQVGVLFEWRIVEVFPFKKSLGDMQQADKKITERLRYHLIEGLEKKTLSELREERSILSDQLLNSFKNEIRPFGVELVHLKIGRVTPVDRHA